MPGNARGWLVNRFGNGGVAAPFIGNQETLQNHFNTQLHNVPDAVSRRIFKKGIWRVGKLLWAASTPIAANANRFAGWNRTKRTTNAEQNRQMNCWEGVLYLAYQCDAMSVAKCTNFYTSATTPDIKLRALFGVHQLLNIPAGNIPNVGDVLSFEDVANGNVINHIALYAGSFGGQHYIFHNLSYHGHTTGLAMGGGFHFESLTSVRLRYHNNVNIYFNQPFWEVGAPTYAYFNAL